MKRIPLLALAGVAALLWFATPAFAHRLNEYLEAATISLARGRVELRLRLVAGVAAAPKVLALVDANGDGVISDAEQRAYGERVRRDISLGVDGRDAPLSLVSSSFLSESEIREGTDDIVLTFDADMPRGDANGRLTFENQHQKAIASYLVNTLVPDDSAIHIIAQDRARDQSTYRLDFAIANSTLAAGETSAASPEVQQSLARGDKLALVTTYFWHGVHHILSGFDHLLFLAALVLGAATLWELVKVVTAFTLAHSITLTLAALNLVHLPSRVVEPLIAASIVFVAVQNIFWPGQSHGAQPTSRRVLLRTLSRARVRRRIARDHAPNAAGDDPACDLRLQRRRGDGQPDRAAAAVRVLESGSSFPVPSRDATAFVVRGSASRIDRCFGGRRLLPLHCAGRRVLIGQSETVSVSSTGR